MDFRLWAACVLCVSKAFHLGYRFGFLEAQLGAGGVRKNNMATIYPEPWEDPKKQNLGFYMATVSLCRIHVLLVSSNSSIGLLGRFLEPQTFSTCVQIYPSPHTVPGLRILETVGPH